MLRIPLIFDARTAIAMALFFLGNILQSAAADAVLKPLERPDPTSVAVPDLSSASTRDVDEDYYYFYKPGVSYERAFADLDQCRLYALADNISVATPPDFVPLSGYVEKARPINNYNMSFYANQYGIGGAIGAAVGGFIVGAIDAQAEDDNARATDRRCMAYKGYSRYSTSSDIWDKINAGNDAEKLARKAVIASGTKPPSEAVDP
ncbi:MAG TPA: hypothetical protein VGT78_13010 [Rhizomicrobium sp.]|nr:hypothetical protein [Rhizomicrobium sp.]